METEKQFPLGYDPEELIRKEKEKAKRLSEKKKAEKEKEAAEKK